MLMCGQRKNRGDTLIEVLFAVSVFSLLAVSAISIMNQGTSIAEKSLEITLVREEIDAQAEALRFLHDSYIGAFNPSISRSDYPRMKLNPVTNQLVPNPAGQWAELITHIKKDLNGVSDFGITSSGKCPERPDEAFIINVRKAQFVVPANGVMRSAPIFSQVEYNDISNQISYADGIWIEAARSVENGNKQENTAYIDFHIRACWDSPGQSVPITIGTILRLYEPRRADDA